MRKSEIERTQKAVVKKEVRDRERAKVYSPFNLLEINVFMKK